MKVHVWIILLFFSSIAYAEEDIRWKDADEKMQEQQYEEAAKLYKELSHKSDTVYEEINSRGKSTQSMSWNLPTASNRTVCFH